MMTDKTPLSAGAKTGRRIPTSVEPDTTEKPKFKFEPKPHLVQKLRDHEGLQALAAQLHQNYDQNPPRSKK